MTAFIFNKRLHEELHEHVTEDKHRYLHTVLFQDALSVERTKVLAISRSEDELCREIVYPSIVKIHKDALRKREQMAVCVRQHKREGEITCIVQIEYVQGGKKAEGKKKRKKEKPQHFNQIDEQILRFLCMKLQIRLEKHIALRDARKKAHERTESVNMIRRIIKQKTYKALMVSFKRELTQFLGFKDLGILFYDQEREKFF